MTVPTLARHGHSVGVPPGWDARIYRNRPAELLAAVERLRARGWGVALDDVGADHRSLALMPFVRPDVIKLDLRLVQANSDAAPSPGS